MKTERHTKDKTNPWQRSPNELVTAAEVSNEGLRVLEKVCVDLKERHTGGQGERLGGVGARTQSRKDELQVLFLVAL